MAYPLTSPGVDVSVTDETFYGSSGQGTVPLFIFGTHEYKVHPSGTGVAEGTLPQNANKMFPITSQRELTQMFGNPVFYSSGGTPLHGYELNEYGLHAAYQYLGIANRAFVIRGDIDYSQLLPRTTAPRGEPIAGTYWLDIANTAFGVFESNGGPVPGNAWDSQSVTVLNSSSDLDQITLGKEYPDSNISVVISSNGNLVINGTPVALTSGDTLADVVTKIGAASITNLVANVFQLAGTSRLLLTYSGTDTLIINNTSTGSVLTDLGLTSPGNIQFVPKGVIGLDGDFSVVTSNIDNIIYQKLKPEGVSTTNDPLSVSMWFRVGTDEWKMATPTRAISSSTPTYGTAGTLRIGVDNVGGNQLSVSTTMVDAATVVQEINDTIAALTTGNLYNLFKGTTSANPSLWKVSAWVVGSSIVIVNRTGNDLFLSSPTSVVTNLGLPTSVKGNDLYYSPHYNVPANSIVGDVWIKTTEFNSGAKWSVKQYNALTGAWSVIAAPLLADDATANTTFGADKGIGSLYVRYNLYGTTTDPIASHTIRRWSGMAWENLAYEASSTSPTTEAEEGTSWYNTNFRVDIMVGDGDQWKGYKNYAGNIDTDPNGAILAGSAPLYQTDGTPLVDNDIWIDTSDLENYPKMYRYNATSRKWTAIDITDQTTPFGIVFADARWTADGSKNGDQDMSSMLVSDYCDPDAPDPRVYPDGMLLFNTRFSTYNVKEWRPNYFTGEYGNGTDYTIEEYNVGFSTFDPVSYAGRWVTTSGLKTDGSPYMGRKAQRALIVKALAATISGNEDIRAESVYFNMIGAPGYPELIDEMVTLNVDKKSIAFIVGDCPARLSASSAALQSWANPTTATGNGEDGITISDFNVGVYYPWGMSTNTDGSDVAVPPSTMVMRTIAYSDSIAYPWLAPAGYTRGLITNATAVGYVNAQTGEWTPVTLNPGQRDLLYINRINPIAYIVNRGLVVMGQKTRHNLTTALDRVNVARLIEYLRFNLDQIAAPFIMEPNDPHTRDSLRTTIERFLSDLVGLRGIYDFLVVCDETNNTPARVNRYELWADVLISPVRAAEFIYIPIRTANYGDDLQALYGNTSVTG